ncbi:MAG: 16S rRNA (adenine(1518)-N(6)/adenine(1519)-N(6))-dimethyltransferase RsmA [Rickettsiales bacterium]|jgi:16S rRNA (adenine1518-N6/adenine1519-N6)-dimethyltransferase|nr:16S rRNA (adenine(1518)-N(6)/adenine(1519)-N(6))-dimethyltransferase RsmA [Rickettsiales bacterium]
MAGYCDGLAPVGDFIARYGLAAKKSLGQNFILDLNLTGRIARAVPDLEDSVVVEVGPGPGALTRALLGRGAKKVVAIEFDSRAIGALEEIGAAYPDRLHIMDADALKVDWRTLKAEFAPAAPLRICANLPYNISIPLLVGWLEDGLADSMALMFQLEVGRRIVAKPGNKDYGRISILAQLTNKVKLLFEVAPSNFHPRPKVSSCIVGFEKLAIRPAFDEILKVEEVVKAAFSQRRKMLRSALRNLFADEVEMNSALAAAGIAPTSRAEEVAPENYLMLARILIG